MSTLRHAISISQLQSVSAEGEVRYKALNCSCSNNAVALMAPHFTMAFGKVWFFWLKIDYTLLSFAASCVSSFLRSNEDRKTGLVVVFFCLCRVVEHVNFLRETVLNMIVNIIFYKLRANQAADRCLNVTMAVMSVCDVKEPLFWMFLTLPWLLSGRPAPANESGTGLCRNLVLFGSPKRKDRGEHSATVCSCFHFSSDQRHHCPEDELEAGPLSSLMIRTHARRCSKQKVLILSIQMSVDIQRWSTDCKLSSQCVCCRQSSVFCCHPNMQSTF